MRNLGRIENWLGFGAMRGLELYFGRLGRRSHFRRGRLVENTFLKI